jgi:hypothetical protein
MSPGKALPPKGLSIGVGIRAPKVEECRVKKVYFALSLAALTGACGLTGEGFMVPTVAVVSPNYQHGFGYYTPVGPTISYRPYLGHHVFAYRRHHYAHWRHAHR